VFFWAAKTFHAKIVGMQIAKGRVTARHELLQSFQRERLFVSAVLR
jgi:hypothetical protein